MTRKHSERNEACNDSLTPQLKLNIVLNVQNLNIRTSKVRREKERYHLEVLKSKFLRSPVKLLVATRNDIEYIINYSVTKKINKFG